MNDAPINNPTNERKAPFKRRLATALGVVILGALGNALWEVVKPGFVAVRNGLLSLTSLGLDRVRNATYADAALGFHEHASNVWLGIFGLLLLGFGVIGLLWAFMSPLGAIRTVGPSLSDAERASNQRRAEMWLRILGVLLLLACGFTSGSLLRESYGSVATAQFEQLFNTIAPTIDEQTRLLLRSQFAQVRSRADYVAVLDRMRSIARARSLRVSEFDPW